MSSTRPSEAHVIGVDIGTTLTKAVAFAADGTALRRAARPTVLHRSQPGHYEQDPEQVVATVLATLEELDTGPVAAVGLTGQGDGLWLVDGHGRPTRPAISWLDARAAGVIAEWEASGLLDEAFQRTGNRAFAGCAAPILAWLDRHSPAVLDQSATATTCRDVVLQRLTGVRATECSNPAVPLFDPQTRDYADDLVVASGLEHRRDLLPPVVEMPSGLLGYPAGGLPAGTPIVSGPYDLPAAAWGAGVEQLGDGLLIAGTTLACQVLTDRVGGGEPAGLTLSTWHPKRWLRAMPAMVGTAALDWVLALIGADHDELPGLLATGDSTGLSVLPFFAEAGERAPFVAPAARARIDGLHTGVGRADVVRAVCESIAFSARHCLTAAGLTGQLTACGGGVRTRAWTQIFADVLDRPIRVLEDAEIGARGAAQAALHAIGEQPLPPMLSAVTVWPSGDRTQEMKFAEYLKHVSDARSSWRNSL